VGVPEQAERAAAMAQKRMILPEKLLLNILLFPFWPDVNFASSIALFLLRCRSPSFVCLLPVAALAAIYPPQSLTT
jgi:hypothetical protein